MTTTLEITVPLAQLHLANDNNDLLKGQDLITASCGNTHEATQFKGWYYGQFVYDIQHRLVGPSNYRRLQTHEEESWNGLRLEFSGGELYIVGEVVDHTETAKLKLFGVCEPSHGRYFLSWRN